MKKPKSLKVIVAELEKLFQVPKPGSGEERGIWRLKDLNGVVMRRAEDLYLNGASTFLLSLNCTQPQKEEGVRTGRLHLPSLAPPPSIYQGHQRGVRNDRLKPHHPLTPASSRDTCSRKKESLEKQMNWVYGRSNLRYYSLPPGQETSPTSKEISLQTDHKQKKSKLKENEFSEKSISIAEEDEGEASISIATGSADFQISPNEMLRPDEAKEFTIEKEPEEGVPSNTPLISQNNPDEAAAPVHRSQNCRVIPSNKNICSGKHDPSLTCDSAESLEQKDVEVPGAVERPEEKAKFRPVGTPDNSSANKLTETAANPYDTEEDIKHQIETLRIEKNSGETKFDAPEDWPKKSEASKRQADPKDGEERRERPRSAVPGWYVPNPTEITHPLNENINANLMINGNQLAQPRQRSPPRKTWPLNSRKTNSLPQKYSDRRNMGPSNNDKSFLRDSSNVLTQTQRTLERSSPNLNIRTISKYVLEEDETQNEDGESGGEDKIGLLTCDTVSNRPGECSREDSGIRMNSSGRNSETSTMESDLVGGDGRTLRERPEEKAGADLPHPPHRPLTVEELLSSPLPPKPASAQTFIIRREP